MLDVGILNPAKYNPRKKLKPGDKTYEDIKRSLSQFGMVQNLIWNKRTGTLIAGHQRLTVGKREYGWKTAPCCVVDLPIEQEKALNVLMNKVGEGNWSTVKLADLLAELALNPQMELTDLGFSESELEELLKKPAAKTTRDPEDAPAPPKNPKTKPGDLYHIISADGHPEHRLICGSSLERETWEKLLGETRPALVFTDPPYGVAYQSKAKSGKMAQTTIQNDELQRQALQDFLLPAFRLAHEFCAPDASIYCFFATREHIAFEQALRKAEWNPTQELIWAKQMNLGRSNYHWAHEPCFYGGKIGGTAKWYGDRCQTTLWQDDRPDFNSMKKEALIEILNELADQTTVWDEKRDPPSSYIHPCLPPWTPVLTATGWKPIETIRPGELVMTADGTFQPVTDVSHHGGADTLWTITVEGIEVPATGNHPFLIWRAGWIIWLEAAQIRPGDYTLTPLAFDNEPDTQKPCQENRTGNPPQDQSRRKDTGGSTTRESDDSACNTSSSGKPPTDQSPPDLKSTIGTTTSRTTESKTSTWSMPLHTSGCTRVARSEMEFGGSHARPAGRQNPPPQTTGISAGDGSTGENADLATVGDKLKKSRFAAHRVESVTSAPFEGLVWNLTVAESPTFLTQIGITHNTQKPTSLVRRAMRHSTLPRDTTVDFFAGSGSTMIGGQLQGRATYSIELEPGFCDAIIQRYVETFQECLLFRNGEEIDPQAFNHALA